MWLDNLFGALKEFFGFARQERDPEVIRLNEIRAIRACLELEHKKRDALLNETTTPSNKESNAALLGAVDDRIVELRLKLEKLSR